MDRYDKELILELSALIIVGLVAIAGTTCAICSINSDDIYEEGCGVDDNFYYYKFESGTFRIDQKLNEIEDKGGQVIKIEDRVITKIVLWKEPR